MCMCISIDISLWHSVFFAGLLFLFFLSLCMQQRVPVPNEKKDHKYWDRRKKNNQAAKRSRDTRKKRIEEEIKTAKEAITENQKLKQEVDVSQGGQRCMG